jgi:hypothetical protein
MGRLRNARLVSSDQPLHSVEGAELRPFIGSGCLVCSADLEMIWDSLFPRIDTVV